MLYSKGRFSSVHRYVDHINEVFMAVPKIGDIFRKPPCGGALTITTREVVDIDVIFDVELDDAKLGSLIVAVSVMV